MKGYRTALAIALAGVAVAPAIARAQNQCVIPQSLPKSRAVFPPPGETVRAPLTGYVLALTWSPQFCKKNGKDSSHAPQCGAPNRFGFVLHGLWPDGPGRDDPRWCKPVPAVSPDVLRQTFCATPSASLMQHEWAKHGSCIASDAGSYFDRARSAYGSLRFPDMDALARAQPTVASFTAALAAANPGLAADMVRVQITPLRWLEAVKICLGMDYRPRACPADIEGAGSGTALRIWLSR